MHKPYIGVTGIMTPQERRAVTSAFGIPRTHHLMRGVLVSPKTLAGGTNKYPHRYPPIGEVHKIFDKTAGVFNCIHTTEDEQKPLNGHLMRIINACGSNVHGFQLNMCWPSVKELAEFHENTFFGYRVVLQVGRRAMEQVDYQPPLLVERLREYREVIHDVLIDGSGGKGIPLDVAKTCDYLQAIEDWEPDLGKGFAGGLSAKTLYSLANTILMRFPNASIDAEGALRHRESDDLDLILASAYLEEAQAMLRQNRLMKNSLEKMEMISA